jgi:uncharacterized damage-inducible protein DinB
MNAQEVHALFAYDRWANARLLEAVGRLSRADFTRELGGSVGSVRGTLVHVLWGERRWLQFWREGSLMPDPDVGAFPDVATLATAWADLARDRTRFAESLTDGRLVTEVSVRGGRYTLGELIQHAVSHSTYHRGQVALLLRLLGETPPATDYRLFLSETRERVASTGIQPPAAGDITGQRG